MRQRCVQLVVGWHCVTSHYIALHSVASWLAASRAAYCVALGCVAFHCATFPCRGYRLQVDVEEAVVSLTPASPDGWRSRGGSWPVERRSWGRRASRQDRSGLGLQESRGERDHARLQLVLQGEAAVPAGDGSLVAEEEELGGRCE